MTLIRSETTRRLEEMRGGQILSRASALALLAVLTGAQVPVAAQSTGQPQGQSQESAASDIPQLEEIVVTSRRYEETVQDVPMALNVLTPDFIEKQRVTTIDEIMAITPGATFTFFNKVNPEASIRGIQTATPGNATSESGVQLLVDDVVVSKDFMRARPLFDLERVEVLRGPQGTAFGRNASLGAVHFVTKRPTRDFEAGVKATAGVRDLFEADGYISGPLSDSLSARFAFNFDTFSGDTEDAITGQGLGGTENFAFRASLLYEPTSRFSVFLKGEYFQDNDESPVRRSADPSIPQILAIDDPRRCSNSPEDPDCFIVPNMPPFPITFQDPDDPFKTVVSDADLFFNREVWSLSAEMVWEIADGINVTSVTAYQEGKSRGRQDILGTPVDIGFQDNSNSGWTLSEEIRIDNQASGDRFRWLAGFFYLADEENRLETNRFFVPAPGNPQAEPPFGFPRVPTEIVVGDQKGRTEPSIAFFGELNYDITPRLTVTYGGRWTQDKKNNRGSARGFGFAPIIAGLEGCAPPFVSIVCASPEDPAGFDPVFASRTFDRYTQKGSIEYQVAEGHMLYALASQGWRSGGFQPDARTSEAAEIPFEPERTLNFEWGWKGEIAQRVQFAVNGFWMQLKNTQVNQFIQAGTGFFQLFSNAGKIRSVGFEGEFTWAVTPDFRIGGTGAAFDVEFQDTSLNLQAGQDPIVLDGTRPDGAAEWTASAFGEYDVHIPGGSTVSTRVDLTARSNVFDDVGEQPDRVRPSLTQIGARMTWTSPDQRFDVSVWGRNLNEDEDIFNIGPSQANTLQPPVQFGNRRTIGATASFRY